MSKPAATADHARTLALPAPADRRAVTVTALALAALALAGLAGCGDPAADPAAIIGLYQVSHHSRAQADTASAPVDCNAEGPADPAPPFFAIVASDFADLEYQTCTGADLSTCTFTLINFLADADGYHFESSNTQTGGGTDCALYHSEYRATPDGDTLRIEAREWIVYPEPAPSDCALGLAESLSLDDGCYSVEVIEGARQGGA
jgi:hypothetical protein